MEGGRGKMLRTTLMSIALFGVTLTIPAFGQGVPRVLQHEGRTVLTNKSGEYTGHFSDTVQLPCMTSLGNPCPKEPEGIAGLAPYHPWRHSWRYGRGYHRGYFGRRW